MISTDPPDGTVYFDGVDQGVAPVTVWVYTTGSPRHTVVVEKDGYQTWVQLLTTNPGKDQTIAVNAVLVPGASYGVLGWNPMFPGSRSPWAGRTMNVPATFSPVTQDITALPHWCRATSPMRSRCWS